MSMLTFNRYLLSSIICCTWYFFIQCISVNVPILVQNLLLTNECNIVFVQWERLVLCHNWVIISELQETLRVISAACKYIEIVPSSHRRADIRHWLNKHEVCISSLFAMFIPTCITVTIEMNIKRCLCITVCNGGQFSKSHVCNGWEIRIIHRVN